ncbi:hypothetical protein EW146_g4122 [Bondarzewia mesenterica]|uniref:Nucleolar protein 12 n=1 Tax=Bondarzewia mesenterica TaxID=1095465 RepID=A0A4S4LWJ2_9AGAM|nr:hypothetical protein EW146_g4122 [Bondarzewia mesenterica]
MQRKSEGFRSMEESLRQNTNHAPSLPKKGKKGKASASRSIARVNALEDDEQEDADLEDMYLAGQTKGTTGTSVGQDKEEKAQESDSSSDDEGDLSQLVHESVSKKDRARGARSKKLKYVPPDETAERRNARTIFIGNVPIDAAKKKGAYTFCLISSHGSSWDVVQPLLKQLKQFVLSHVPSAKIESTRLRSVAFKNPTSKLTDDADTSKNKTHSPSDGNEGRAHDRDRAASWRSSKEGMVEDKEKEKKRLTPQEKKRVAFIKHEIHDAADSVNAYVVFAHPPPPDTRASNVPVLEVMDPYDAARLAVERCNGLVFIDRTLRVDRVGRSADAEGKVGNAVAGDPKKTVFVGNLDFASKEEDLRVFFEGVIGAERGPRRSDDSEEGGAEEDEEEDDAIEGKNRSSKLKTWVTMVRIVRDKDTQLGKGFAYVQFADRECVDEILALEEGKLKFAKRKLRVQRCKSLTGDPPRSLGLLQDQKLPLVLHCSCPKATHLWERNWRICQKTNARRPKRQTRIVSLDVLAKKKARMALTKAGVSEQRKDRERVRKSTKDRKDGFAAKPQKKGRVRSEHIRPPANFRISLKLVGTQSSIKISFSHPSLHSLLEAQELNYSVPVHHVEKIASFTKHQRLLRYVCQEPNLLFSSLRPQVLSLEIDIEISTLKTQ